MRILKHEKEIVDSFFYHHRVTVEVDPAEDHGTEEELAVLVACRAGYHPAGYDMYRRRVRELGGNLYHIEWESAMHCD